MTTLDQLAKKVNKEYASTGEDVIVKGSVLKDRTFRRLPSGSLALDIILGGGWPLNLWNELIGQPSHGKTAIVLKTIAENQRLNPQFETVWVASEDFVPDWAAKCGVDLDRITLVQSNVTEVALQFVVDVLENRAADAVVIDSLPALIPRGEDDKDVGEWGPGLQARLINQFMRKSGSAMRRSLTSPDRDCLCMVINQWRYMIGVIHGDPRTTPGGKGKDFSFFTRVEVVRDEWLEAPGKKRVGQTIKLRTLKNKTAPPSQVAVVDFYFDDLPGLPAGSFDSLKEIFNLGAAFEVIEQGGGYYSFNGERIGERGKEAALAQVREDVDLKEALVKEVMRVSLRHP